MLGSIEKMTRYMLGIGFWAALLLMGAGVTADGAQKTAPAAPAKGKAAPAQAKPYTVAKNPYLGAIVIDAASGRVLLEDQADAIGHPASVLKLMDLLIILEKIKRGELSLQDTVKTSAKAAQTGGTQVWLAQNEVFTVEELLFALMMRSANDAAVALAEKVAGSTEAFVELMNKRAAEIGMRNTVFRSVHGLPPSAGQDPRHDTITARDLALLCRELLKHPEALRYTSEKVRPFRPGPKMVEMRSHNHLLTRVEGCDGLKTGYTYRAGFSIAVTVARNGQRIVVVVLGSPSTKIRDDKAVELVSKGFASLRPVAGAPAAPAPAKTVRR